MTDMNNEEIQAAAAQATAIQAIAYALRDLGNGNAADPRGAVEFLGVQVKEGLDGIAEAISDLAAAVREHTQNQ